MLVEDLIADTQQEPHVKVVGCSHELNVLDTDENTLSSYL